MMMRWIGVLVGCLVLIACSGGDDGPVLPSIDETTQRTISQGELVGFRAENDAQVWKAIPFAASTEGDLRWRAPRPPARFQQRFEATAPAERCPQVTNTYDVLVGYESGILIGSEDCLKLDIYAPSDAEPGDDLPIMMWVHGGGNVWGYADQYDGANLAENEDVIVVVIQYRLGPMGFFSHPALRDYRNDEADNAANFALLDVVGALEWTRDNIAQFGGDAERVTLFGESAGGSIIAGLLVTPQAEGLFHRAILQSAWPVTVSQIEAEEGGPGIANPSSQAIREFARVAADETMRATSLDRIYDVYKRDDGFGVAIPTLIADGVTIPEGGIHQALASGERLNPVTIVTGANRDEMKFFNMFNPEFSRLWFGSMIQIKDQRWFDLVSDYQSRIWQIRAVDSLAESLKAGGHEDVWAYRFDWDEGGSFLFMDMAKIFGAGHSIEIPFVFNDFEFFGPLDRVLFTGRNEAARQDLADMTGAYWSHTARVGTPADGGDNLVDWRRWGEVGWRMRLDTVTSGGPEIMAGIYTLEELANDLANDDRLEEGEACTIIDYIIASDRASGLFLADALSCEI